MLIMIRHVSKFNILIFFRTACTDNHFGAKCSFTCNPNCGGPSNACDSFDGFCKDGCDDGYLGDRCEIRK